MGGAEVIINASAHQIPLADKSVNAVVTSPPYFGLRRYEGQQEIDWPSGVYSPCTGAPPCINVPEMRSAFGAEPTVEAYIWHSLLILRECRRVLRDDGCLWWNLGDSFSQTGKSGGTSGGKNYTSAGGGYDRERDAHNVVQGNLLGIPHRLMLAAQADGWLIRNDCIWGKVAPMPESVKGWGVRNGEMERGSWRHTRAHEFVFQMAKQMGYWADGEAVKESGNGRADKGMSFQRETKEGPIPAQAQLQHRMNRDDAAYGASRNPRSVLQPPPSNYSGSHFAVFPVELIRPLIMASVPRRCCVICGMGWSPVVDRSVSFASGSGKSGRKPSGKGSGGIQTESGTYDIRMGPVVTSEISSYRPSCNCGTDESRPGVVLDPFCGSGTTGEVARECLVDFIGLDISFSYLNEQAAWRAERQVSAAKIESMPLFAGAGDAA